MMVGLLNYPADVVAYMAGDNPTPESTDERLFRYSTRVCREFDELKPWLPEKVGAILDIGAGPAGIDALFGYHYGAPLEIHLMDGDGTAERQNSFNESIEAWADRRIGASLVKANVPAGVDVTAHEPDPSLTIPTDMIVSLKSWGHHYPISVYLDLVRRSLRLGGTLIVDIRRGTDGAARLTDAGFAYVERAGGTSKCDRLVFERAIA